jgi:hypothetical protein
MKERHRYMKRNLLSVCSSALLVLGLSFAGVTAASAEDVVTPEAVASEVATDTAPATEVAPEVVATTPVEAEATSTEAPVAEVGATADVSVAADTGPPVVANTATTTAPKYHAVLWEAALNLTPKFPQKLASPSSHVVTDSKDIHQLDAFATKCHTTYQFDLYANDASTDKLIASGVLNGGDESWPKGEDQVYTTFTTDPCAPPVVKACPTITDGGTSTNLNANGWTFTETRATGHNEYVKGGIHVFTESNASTDKAAGYHALNTTISGLGKPSIEFGATLGVKPGLQIVLSPYQILVSEPDSYGDNFWSNKPYAGVPAGMGYAAYGTLDQFLAAKDSTVTAIGYSLGSGVKGDAVIKSITGGCVNFKFDHEEKVVTPEKPPVEVVSVPVTTHDCTTVTDTITTTTTTTDWVLVDNKWVKGTPVVTTEVTTIAGNPADCPVVVPPAEPKCDDLTQSEAQDLFNSDKDKYGYLDGDHDGIACESSPVTPPEQPTYPENPAPTPETPVYVPAPPAATPTPVATPTPSATPAPVAAQKVASTDSLAYTGIEAVPTLVWGLLLVILGALIFVSFKAVQWSNKNKSTN